MRQNSKSLHIIFIYKKLIWGFFFFSCFCISEAQENGRFETIDSSLRKLVEVMPGLNEEIDLTVSELSLQEFLRNIANTTNLNLNIDQSIAGNVTNNFSKVPAIDILLFLCKEYDLDIIITGRIISIYKHKNPPPVTPIREPNILYDSVNDFLSLDLKNDSLSKVLKKITDITGKNVIPHPEVYNRLITVYLQDMLFDQSLYQMAFANNLKLIEKENFYLLGPNVSESESGSKVNNRSKKDNRSNTEFFYSAKNSENITVKAFDVPISEVINEISGKLKVNYFIYSEMMEPTTVNLTNIAYDELLAYLLNGTKYSYIKNNDIYLIGERQSENIRKTKVIKLQNRSVIDITQAIPQSMNGEVEIKEFKELNSLILSGSGPQINEIEQFLKIIDKVVPVILIEVLIVVHKSGFTVSTGIEAGLAKEPVESSGSLMPFDITLGAASVNSIINSFNGLGMINLGNVSPNFYVSLRALEEQGVIDILSTPRLATLNGHEATLSIGETEYYIEEKSQIFANQTTTQEKIRQFIPVTADFTLTIYPIVSGDDQITLDIKVEQSDFTGTKLAPGAPPDQVSRSFNSLIRVRNEDMILLGGLEDKSKSNAGRGWPLLSRIPVLKWIFSSREKKESIEKLNIFIKPTVIY